MGDPWGGHLPAAIAAGYGVTTMRGSLISVRPGPKMPWVPTETCEQ